MSAPKQLAKRNRLERKRRRKQEAMRRRQSRRDERRPSGVLESFPSVSEMLGGIKMSSVLEEFVAPWRDEVEGREEYSKLLSLGVVAWNAAMEPEERRAILLNSATAAATEGMSHEGRLACRKLIDHLIARKLRYFASCRRTILTYHLDDLPDGGLHLSVASLLN